MKVKVIAPFSIPGQAADGDVDLAEGARIRDLLRQVRAPFFHRLLPVSVNGEQVSRDHRLKEGDLVIFIAPISGG